MQFDIFTVLTASCSVIFLSGLILVFFWSRNRRAPWLAWWAVAFCLLGVANILVMSKAALPDYMHSALGSSMLIVGFGLVWQAARVFEGRKPIYWPIAMMVSIWMALFFVPEIRAGLGARIAITSSMMAVGLGLAAKEIWSGRAERLPSRMPVVVVLSLLSALFASRLITAPFAPYPMGQAPVDPLVVTSFNGFLIIASIAVTVLLISMTLERAESGQRTLALSDPLTGLANRRALEELFGKGPMPDTTAVVVLDLDRFKLINDNFGHAAGDEVISAFAQVCREELRQVDFAVRLGGEEFGLVLPRTDRVGAEAVADRVRRKFAETVVPIPDGAVAATVSAGVYLCTGEVPVTLAEAMAAADQALYQAKTAGRDRVYTAYYTKPKDRRASRGFEERCLALRPAAAAV